VLAYLRKNKKKTDFLKREMSAMKEKNIKKIVCFIFIMGVVFFVGCQAPSKCSLIKTESMSNEENTKELIELEKAALDRWNNGDPTGYLELYSDDFTYFDEFTKARLDGLETIKKLYASAAGKIYSARYEMLNPKVQWFGQTGILTYNLVTYSKEGNVTSRWNSTEVYARDNEEWKIVHSHWSFTKHEKLN
jgi:ketosteroid isomerase-like protein